MAELVGKLVAKNKAIFSFLERVATQVGVRGPGWGRQGVNGEERPRLGAATHLGSQAGMF